MGWFCRTLKRRIDVNKRGKKRGETLRGGRPKGKGPLLTGKKKKKSGSLEKTKSERIFTKFNKGLVLQGKKGGDPLIGKIRFK